MRDFSIKNNEKVDEILDEVFDAGKRKVNKKGEIDVIEISRNVVTSNWCNT
jgi:hypothetical protein